MNIIQLLLFRLYFWFRDKLYGRPTFVEAYCAQKGFGRSSQWALVRAKHLKLEGKCQYCYSIEKLEVHHMIPFHLDPSLELDDNNLITLCDGANECHLNRGHLGNWRNYNSHIRIDCDNKNKNWGIRN